MHLHSQLTARLFRKETMTKDRVADICERKSHGHPNSRAAQVAHRVQRPTQRQIVLDAVIEAGTRGATNHELCAKLNRLPYHISPRLSELKRDELIFETGENRQTAGFDPASVVVAVQFREQWQREHKVSSSAE